jgi:transcriptional regulator with XRE-family HTH domain
MNNDRNNPAKRIGDNIRRYRAAKRLSQAALGAQLGVRYQTIQKYEFGHIDISVSNLLKLAHILGTTTERLVA